MAITFVASTVAQLDTATNSIAVPTPTGVTSGDVLLVSIGAESSFTISAPAGWALTVGPTVMGTQARRLWTFHRVAGASEPASYTFPFADNMRVGASCRAWRGVSNSSPIEASAQLTGSFADGYVDTASVTASVGAEVESIGAFASRVGPDISIPAGTTSRAIQGGPAVPVEISHRVVSQTRTVSGATPVHRFTGSGEPASHTVALRVGNTAPSAPTNLSPAGATIDRAVTNRFSWTFNDPDAGDSQSKYDLDYRVAGGTTWTTVTGTTPNQFHDFAGGTFAAGNWEWRVRTYDALGVVGPYSAVVTFTAADKPPAPTISDPINGQTIAAENYTVVWSTPTQTAYQLRRIADNAGAPNASIVYFDTGTVEQATIRSRAVTFETNNRFEHVQVRIRNNGLWSDWASVRVQISYTPPATPTATIAHTGGGAALMITATHPTPGTGQPTVTHHDIHRRAVGDPGDGIRIAANITPTGAHTDWTTGHRQQVAYRIRAYGSNGTSTYSAWQETIT